MGDTESLDVCAMQIVATILKPKSRKINQNHV